MPSSIIIYRSYLGGFLLLLKAILFFIATFIFRPKDMNKLPFLQRVQISIFPLNGEKTIFSESAYRKLRIYRGLWIAIFILLIIRILVGLWMSSLYSAV